MYHIRPSWFPLLGVPEQEMFDKKIKKEKILLKTELYQINGTFTGHPIGKWGKFLKRCQQETDKNNFTVVD